MDELVKSWKRNSRKRNLKLCARSSDGAANRSYLLVVLMSMCARDDSASALLLSLTNRSLQVFPTRNVYVVSHAKSFGPRLRSHLWHVFESMVSLTAGQERQFERWVTPEGLKFDLYVDSEDNDSDGGDAGSHTDSDCSTGSLHEYGWHYDEDY